jgi:uncharacterized protein
MCFVGKSAMQTNVYDAEKLIDLCRKNAVASVGIFGSTARGEATADSDIDLLVEFSERKSLVDQARLKRELSEALGQKVDLLTKDAISPYLQDGILSEVQMIYETR